LLLSIVVLCLPVLLKAFGGSLNALEKPFYNDKGKVLSVSLFLPNSFLSLGVFLLVFSVSGLIAEAIGFKKVSMLSSIIFAIAFNAVLEQFIKPYFLKRKKKLPQKDDLSGLNAIITQEISGEEGDFGKIKFLFEGKAYEYKALSANSAESGLKRNFKAGEKVIIVLEDDGACFVCCENDLFSILDKDYSEKHE